MDRTLDRFVVLLKRHGERSLLAYGYTEDPATGRTIFHRQSDGSDAEHSSKRKKLWE